MICFVLGFILPSILYKLLIIPGGYEDKYGEYILATQDCLGIPLEDIFAADCYAMSVIFIISSFEVTSKSFLF